MLKREKGITLIALVVTIIVLLILAGISIAMLTGDNGILINAKEAREENNKETATEIINLKIADTQMKIYSKEQRIPTLQELADDFCEDNEIEYVNIKKQETSEINEKITVGENTEIYTKLEEYPYEFEIGNDLKIANVTKSGTDLIGKVPEGYIKPSGIKQIISNGEHDVKEYEKVNVNVPVPEGYIQPKGTQKITTKSNQIDVSQYQYVDTTGLYTASEATGEGTYWKSGTVNTKIGVNSVDVGFVPKMIVFNKKTDYALLLYNSLKNNTIGYNYRMGGVTEVEFNSNITEMANIRTIGSTVTFYTIDDSTWDWFAIK